MNEVFELMRSDNTLYANRTLAKAIGLNEAIIFGALLGKAHYYRSEGKLDEEGMFYSTAEDLEESTTLTQRQQDRAVKRLEQLELIQTKVKGMPARKHFSINQDAGALLDLLKSVKVRESISAPVSTKSENKVEQNVETSIDKMSKQDSTKSEDKIQQNVEQNLSNKTYIKNLTSEEKKEQKKDSSPGETNQAELGHSNKFEPAIKAWNSLGLTKIIAVTGKRETMLNARINQYGIDQVVKAIKSIENSKFLQGQNPKSWVIYFDWFVKPNNFIKVLEGNYTNKSPTAKVIPVETDSGKYKSNIPDELMQKFADKRSDNGG